MLKTYGLKPRHRLPLGTVDGFVERIAARDVQDAVRSYRKLRFQGVYECSLLLWDLALISYVR